MRLAINFIAFQAGWFSCVIGAAQDLFWLGPLVVLAVFGLHLFMTGDHLKEISIGLLFMAAGFAVDSQLTFFGIYTPRQHLIPHPFSAPWLLAMWLNLATVFNVALRWLHDRYRMAALFGAFGGPAAYYGGGSLGALTFHEPLILNLLITGAVWAVATPLLIYGVGRINLNFD